ncbi:MAG: hypothetical protein ACPG5P_09465, partial [Saprospiraceae bacterium]
MPNPYDDMFGNDNENNKEEKPWDSNLDKLEYGIGEFEDDGKEPLSEILDKIESFNEKAESFTQLLTKVSAIDHKVSRKFLQIFVGPDKKHNKGSLKGERKYHQTMLDKFEGIISPMRELALSHLDTIEQFNNDIDKNYFSIEKSERIIRKEIQDAIDGIQFQRKILGEAAEHLGILEDGLADAEMRIEEYINVGGV